MMPKLLSHDRNPCHHTLTILWRIASNLPPRLARYKESSLSRIPRRAGRGKGLHRACLGTAFLNPHRSFRVFTFASILTMPHAVRERFCKFPSRLPGRLPLSADQRAKSVRDTIYFDGILLSAGLAHVARAPLPPPPFPSPFQIPPE